MKLGMNMLLWTTDVSGPEFDPLLERSRSSGYDGVEIPSSTRGAEVQALGEGLGVARARADGCGARRR